MKDEGARQCCNWKNEQHACFHGLILTNFLCNGVRWSVWFPWTFCLFVFPIQALQLFWVKAKIFLLLECVLVCLIMAPINNATYNGMKLNSGMSQSLWGECVCECILNWFGFYLYEHALCPIPRPISNDLTKQGVYWCISALLAQSVWTLVYPDRYRRIWVIIMSIGAVVLIIPPAMSRVCNGTFITYYLDTVSEGYYWPIQVDATRKQCHVRVSLLYTTCISRFVRRCVHNMELYRNIYTPYHCRSGMQSLRAGSGICSWIQQLLSHLLSGWSHTTVSWWLHDDDQHTLPIHFEHACTLHFVLSKLQRSLTKAYLPLRS